MNHLLSTTKKGDDFELQMFEMINTMIVEEKLPINCKYSKVYMKKAYYSSKRQSNIIVDISIECTMPEEEKPSTYVMIECKNYSHAVPVNDVEEFYAKTQQITGLDVKAIMLVSTSLQKGALNYAQSMGIRVMRIRPGGEKEVLSYRKEKHTINNNTKNYINTVLALTSMKEYTIFASYIGLGPGKVYFSLSEILHDAIMPNIID